MNITWRAVAIIQAGVILYAATYGVRARDNAHYAAGYASGSAAVQRERSELTRAELQQHAGAKNRGADEAGVRDVVAMAARDAAPHQPDQAKNETTQAVDPAQWSPELHHKLAVCAAAEVGMDTDARPSRAEEQLAVLGALVKRWHLRQRVRPGLTLLQHANYCRVFRSKRVNVARPWLLELPADGVTKPEHWPTGVGWQKHGAYWRDTLKRVDDWQAGLLVTPCKDAEHWGNVAIGDHPMPYMKLLGCGGQGRAFANQFYATTGKQF